MDEKLRKKEKMEIKGGKFTQQENVELIYNRFFKPNYPYDTKHAQLLKFVLDKDYYQLYVSAFRIKSNYAYCFTLATWSLYPNDYIGKF